MRGVIRGSGANTRYIIDGKQVSKEEFDEAFPDKPLGDGSGLIAWHKPILSDALAVHPKQVKAVIEADRKKGVSVEYSKDGRPIFRDRGQRRAYCKAHGYFDRSAGYGDVAPEGRRPVEDKLDIHE